MKILMVLTSHDQLGNTGRKTGFWLEEFAAPYYAFKDAGAEISDHEIASWSKNSSPSSLKIRAYRPKTCASETNSLSPNSTSAMLRP